MMGITWLSKNVYHIGDNSSQTVVRILNYPILFGESSFGWYIRFGNKHSFGIKITEKLVLFSERNGYKKNIKIGKYYLLKL
jgi:hypothetical protein